MYSKAFNYEQKCKLVICKYGNSVIRFPYDVSDPVALKWPKK